MTDKDGQKGVEKWGISEVRIVGKQNKEKQVMKMKKIEKER